jgi:hypothetical protein
MPTDVSGTINIIAEVVGNSSSPIAGTGSSTTGKPKKDQEDNQNWIKDIWKSSKKMVALLGIGGLLASSKIVSSTMGSIMRIFGTFMDIIIGPIAPLLVRGLVILATVVMWIRKLLTGEAAWSDAWAGLKQWWIDTWEEKGGLWGIIQEGLKNTAGVALIAALFASIVATPMAGAWVMKQFFGVGKFLTKKLLKGALGLAKFIIKAPFKLMKFVATGVRQAFRLTRYVATGLWNVIPKFTRYVGQSLRSMMGMLPMFVKRPFLAAATLIGKMFAKGAVFTKALLRGALGLVSWGVNAFIAAGRFSWNALMLGSGFVKLGVIRLFSMLGLTAMFSAAGAALGGFAALALPFALLGLLIIGVGVTAYWLSEQLWKRAFNETFGQTLDKVDYAHKNEEYAEQHGIASFSAPTTDPFELVTGMYATGGGTEMGGGGGGLIALLWDMLSAADAPLPSNPAIAGQ